MSVYGELFKAQMDRHWRTASIALVSMAGISYQIALVRLLSVSLWYHFAFLVVSLAVLGFGASGVYLQLRHERLKGDVRSWLGRTALGMAGAIVVGYLTIAFVPFEPFRIMAPTFQWVFALVYVFATMAPFFANGLFVAVALVDGAKDSGTLYAADLIGAGFAAVATLGAFSLVGGEGAVWLSAVFAMLAALAVRARPWLVVLALASIVAVHVGPRVAPARIAADKHIMGFSVARLLEDDERLVATRWNALSRVDVVQLGEKHREILIDAGVAVTRVPRIERPIGTYAPIEDFTCLAFGLRRDARVVVLGSGGGWEVACALTHGAVHVDAVELNPAINDLVQNELSSWTGDVFRDPRVRVHTDEARAFLARSPQSWDVIVSAHTISNTASASGAMNLAESYTLTVEAFEVYLERISASGVVFMTRPESQMPRLVANASAALRKSGRDPATHLAVVRLRSDNPQGTEFAAGMLLARQPETLRGIGETVGAHGAELLWGDGVARSPEIVSALMATEDLTTDDRPFFNFRSSWTQLRWRDFQNVFNAGKGSRAALEYAPIGEVSLLVLLVLLALISAVSTAGVLVARRTLWWGRRRRLAASASYFAALGFGYMYAELGLVHRLGLLLGSPTVTFGVVVAGLLVSSGIGAAISQRMAIRELPRAAWMGCVGLVVLGQWGAVLADHALMAGTAGVTLACIAIVAPLGLLLGVPFPLAVRRFHADADLLPIAWAVNGFAGVLGSATSILVATELGFSALMYLAAAAYLAAAFAARYAPS